ncbi:MAG TPA: SulP family inorganic anion transporter [Micromonosporaceae bacterium]|jgi:high affinity sulfate transporter 1|nr:SulP family inorganic anion transporter [Micromonosporaceae bacterium]
MRSEPGDSRGTQGRLAMRLGGRLFPTLHGYRRTLARSDILGGIGAGAVVVPQAMAYATIAGMPVQIGLYTCMLPVVVYAALGGSRTMSVTTTSTIATLSASTLVGAGIAAGSVADLVTLTLLVGVILVIARIARFGSLVENISGAVLTGVKTGVGLTVAAQQLPKLLGVPPHAGTTGFFREVWSALSQLGHANVATVVLSVATIVALVLLARFAPRIPGPLVAVVAALALVPLLNLEQHGVALIAPIPRGLPVPAQPPMHHVFALLPGAFAIALMAFLESVAIARSIRQRDEPSPNNDREMVAIGMASVVGSFFHALPAAGGFSQSAVNQRSGARTQAAALVTAALAVVVALFLAPVLSKLPQATLGAMVFVAVMGLVRPAELRRLLRISPREFALAAITGLVGLTTNLLVAVAVGVVGTLFLVLRELNHVDVTELRRASDTGRIRVARPGDPPVPGALLLRLGGPLYTANVRVAEQAVVREADRRQQTTPSDGTTPERLDVVVLDMTVQGVLSSTVLDGIRDLDRELADRCVTLWIASLPARATATAQRTHWWPGWERRGRVYDTVEDALDALPIAA